MSEKVRNEISREARELGFTMKGLGGAQWWSWTSAAGKSYTFNLFTAGNIGDHKAEEARRVMLQARRAQEREAAEDKARRRVVEEREAARRAAAIVEQPKKEEVEVGVLQDVAKKAIDNVAKEAAQRIEQSAFTVGPLMSQAPAPSPIPEVIHKPAVEVSLTPAANEEKEEEIGMPKEAEELGKVLKKLQDEVAWLADALGRSPERWFAIQVAGRATIMPLAQAISRDIVTAAKPVERKRQPNVAARGSAIESALELALATAPTEVSFDALVVEASKQLARDVPRGSISSALNDLKTSGRAESPRRGYWRAGVAKAA